MFKRFVKLTFVPEKVESFLALFAETRNQIRHFPGCHHLELLQDRQQPHVFFTYSIWESEQALEDYRHSDLFRNTWQKTKQLFGDKPQAWSLDVTFES